VVVPGSKFSGLHSTEDYLANIPMLFQNASGNFTLEYCEITGEDDRLSIIAKGDVPLKDGRHYQSNYPYLLHFREGRISSGKESCDTLHVNEIFGAPKDVPTT
jgi:uncharacterized protein